MSETPATPPTETPEPSRRGGLTAVLEGLSRIGLGQQATRALTTLLVVGVLALVVWGMSRVTASMESAAAQNLQATAQALAAPTLEAATGLSAQQAQQAELLAAFEDQLASAQGIRRAANSQTIIPSRPRVDILVHEVQPGESVFSIAEIYGVKPETVLWGNYDTLQDNPRVIKEGQQLNILPVDGVYYRYNAGESLRTIAQFFGTTPEAIVEWAGNDLDPYETDLDNPPINDGEWLIIPYGERELVDWGPPRISRSNPAVAAYYGPGSCGAITDGPVGNGTFVWPTTSRQISGYNYDANVHAAIDIGGAEGNAIYATDAGVVVYAGWSEYGYGNLVVIDHGNGWQSAYAHLYSYSVSCGQGVFQGGQIGGLGNTGNSTGPHLHFELLSELYGKVNPLNFLIP